MSWGDTFAQAYSAASAAAREVADKSMSSAAAAAAAVARGAQHAAEAASRAATDAKDAVAAGARAMGDAVVSGAKVAKGAIIDGARTVQSAAVVGTAAVARGASAVAAGAANIAGFGARAAIDAVDIAAHSVASAVKAPFRAAQQLFSATKSPADAAISACPDSWPAKKERLVQRQQLIQQAKDGSDPRARAAADRLARNNDAVELARLSRDSYEQYPGEPFTYPSASGEPLPGWNVVPAAELEAKGVSIDDMQKARAVLYRTPPDWPGGPQTVLAFRGTDDLDDVLIDHDQAMALDTRQYKSAMVVGDSVSAAYGSETRVTGHSLGGGKAQAAGVTGGLKGTMFNSAGLHPDTVAPRQADALQFTQYRTTGDPLTGVQNSPAAQTAVAALAGVVAMPLGAGMKLGDAVQKAMGFEGLSPDLADYADKALKAFPRGMRNLVQNGDLLPPALGAIHEVPALADSGAEFIKLNAKRQHSIHSVINGIEQQKTADMASLSN